MTVVTIGVFGCPSTILPEAGKEGERPERILDLRLLSVDPEDITMNASSWVSGRRISPVLSLPSSAKAIVLGMADSRRLGIECPMEQVKQILLDLGQRLTMLYIQFQEDLDCSCTGE